MRRQVLLQGFEVPGRALGIAEACVAFLLSLGLRHGHASEETNRVIGEVEGAARPFVYVRDADRMILHAVLEPEALLVHATFEIIWMFSVPIILPVSEAQLGNTRALARVCSVGILLIFMPAVPPTVW